MGLGARPVLAAVEHWRQPPAAAAAAVAAAAVAEELHTQTAADIQPVVGHIRTVVRTRVVHLVEDTSEQLVDIVTVAGCTAEVLEVGELEQGMQALQEQQWDTSEEYSRYCSPCVT